MMIRGVFRISARFENRHKICARRDKSPKIRNITSKNRKKKNIKIGEKPLTIGTIPLQEGPKPKK